MKCPSSISESLFFCNIFNSSPSHVERLQLTAWLLSQPMRRKAWRNVTRNYQSELRVGIPIADNGTRRTKSRHVLVRRPPRYKARRYKRHRGRVTLRRCGKRFATTTLHSSLALHKTVCTKAAMEFDFPNVQSWAPRIGSMITLTAKGKPHAKTPMIQRVQKRSVAECRESPLTPSFPKCTQQKCTHSLTPCFTSGMARWAKPRWSSPTSGRIIKSTVEQARRKEQTHRYSAVHATQIHVQLLCRHWQISMSKFQVPRTLLGNVVHQKSTFTESS